MTRPRNMGMAIRSEMAPDIARKPITANGGSSFGERNQIHITSHTANHNKNKTRPILRGLAILENKIKTNAMARNTTLSHMSAPVVDTAGMRSPSESDFDSPVSFAP